MPDHNVLIVGIGELVSGEKALIGCVSFSRALLYRSFMGCLMGRLGGKVRRTGGQGKSSNGKKGEGKVARCRHAKAPRFETVLKHFFARGELSLMMQKVLCHYLSCPCP